MKRTVESVMTKDVVVAQEDMPFKDIARLMWAAGVSALPVVDAEDRVVGVVSEADLVLKEELASGGESQVVRLRRRADRAKADGMVARDVMTAPAVTIEPHATLAQAARVMHARRVKRLPVVDAQGRLVGIVSRGDLLRVFLRADDLIRREVEHEVVERTLWLTPKEAGLSVEVTDGVVTLLGEVDRKSAARILVGLTSGIDGVVGVEDRLTYRITTTASRPTARRHPRCCRRRCAGRSRGEGPRRRGPPGPGPALGAMPGWRRPREGGRDGMASAPHEGGRAPAGVPAVPGMLIRLHHG